MANVGYITLASILVSALAIVVAGRKLLGLRFVSSHIGGTHSQHEISGMEVR